MDFEWDVTKNEGNLSKHGIDFNDAKYIFLDSRRIEAIDDRNDYQETRYLTIGNISGRICCVVYTCRNGRIRIISARQARKNERRTYDDSQP